MLEFVTSGHGRSGVVGRACKARAVTGADQEPAPGVRTGVVADELRSFLDGGEAGPVPAEDLDRFRTDLEAAAARAVDLLDGHAPPEDPGSGGPRPYGPGADRSGADVPSSVAPIGLPLRLPKGRVIALAGCERFAVASARADGPTDGADGPSLRLLAGRALDVFVEHEITEGPVADPFEDLLSWLDARGELDTRDQVIAAGERLSLSPLATAARAWAGLDPAWWPRTQAQAAALLAGGAVRCEGRTDVELGGPLTAGPGVVVEVKLGRPHAHHLAEVTHYALLVALRDGRAPAAVARWYPGTGLATMAVTADILESATRRLRDAIGAWAELAVGRPPRERPGPACSWCPDAAACPGFEPAPDPFGADR